MEFFLFFGFLFAVIWIVGIALNSLEPKENTENKLSEPEYDNSYTGNGYQPAIPYEEYLSYLNSIEWKTKAYQRIVIDNYRCQYCGSEVQSMNGDAHTPNIHHLHYRTLKNENVKTDLITLCKSCHHSLHARYSLSDMEDAINFQRTKLVLPI